MSCSRRWTASRRSPETSDSTDGSSSALIFDNTQPTPLTAYYELPALADGASAVPNRTSTGTRLLLSATVQASSTMTTTTTTSTTTTTTTTTSTTTQAPPSAPTIGSASLSARRFRVAFSGRIGHSALAPGAYAAILTAHNTGGRSKPVTLGFVVVAS